MAEVVVETQAIYGTRSGERILVGGRLDIKIGDLHLWTLVMDVEPCDWYKQVLEIERVSREHSLHTRHNGVSELREMIQCG